MSDWLFLQYHKHPSVIGNEIHSFFHREAFADLVLSCAGGCVKAHQLVLASVSPWLKHIFEQNSSDLHTIVLPDVEHADMQLLIQFLYGAEVVVPLRQLGSLQDLTRFLHLDRSVLNFRVETPKKEEEEEEDGVHVRLKCADEEICEDLSIRQVDPENGCKIENEAMDLHVERHCGKMLDMKKSPGDPADDGNSNSTVENIPVEVRLESIDNHCENESNGRMDSGDEQGNNNNGHHYDDDGLYKPYASPPTKHSPEALVVVPSVRTRSRGGTLKNLLSESRGSQGQGNLRVTMLSTSKSGTLQLQCSLCKYECATYEEFKKHEKLHRPAFTCEFCGKGFFIKWNLVAHLRTHTGEKPFLCNFCQQPFRQKAHLIKHISAVHGYKEERTAPHLGTNAYLCSFCGRAFEDKEQVRKHISQEHRDLLKRAY